MAEPSAYGGFWIRFVAYLVDSVILFTAFCLLAFVLVLAGAAGGLGETVAKLLGLLCFAGPVLYWGLMQSSSRQATFGKALLGMKVTDADGERLTPLRSLARELAKIVSSIPMMIGFVLAAFTGRKQALHDMMASTVVVRESGGHLVVGLVIGLFGWLAPMMLVAFIGVSVFAAMMGVSAGMMQQATQDAQKRTVARAAPPSQEPVAQAAKVVETPKPLTPSAVAVSPVAGSAVAAAAPEAKPVVEPKRVVEAPPPRVEAPIVAKVAPKAVDEVPMAREPVRPGPKYNDLMTAVLYTDPEAVGQLLELGRWPDKPDSRGTTPLTAAAMQGDVRSAGLLLQAGANPAPALAVARERRDAAMTSLLERYAK